MIRAAAIFCIVLLASCSTVRDIANSLTALSRLTFRLHSVTGFSLAGVDLSKISDPKRLSVGDALSLTSAFARKALPTTFNLNVETKNPNTGEGTTKKSVLTLKNLDWRLLIDDKPTISGGLGRPFDVPDNGQTVLLPLPVSMDLYSFFADKGYDGILKLALAIGGQEGNAARLKLDALPTVGSPIGNLTYPGRITIVDREFRGS